MTENEVLEYLKSSKRQSNMLGILPGSDIGNTIIKALKEVQQYRAIGTLEECRKSLEICKAMVERNITPDDMENYMKFEDECIKQGFTLDSILKSREKQTAKKPIAHQCPACGNAVMLSEGKCCSNCGQRLDWSEVE